MASILEQFGIDEAQAKELAKPIVAEIAGPLIIDEIKKVLATAVPQYVAQEVKTQIEAMAPTLAKLVVAEIKANSPADPSPAKQDDGMADKVKLFTSLLGNQPAQSAGGLNELANTIGVVMNQIVTPMMGLYSKGKQDAMSEIATLGRTGFQFPWEDQGNHSPAADVAHDLKGGHGS